jgi:hypothetical protein
VPWSISKQARSDLVICTKYMTIIKNNNIDKGNRCTQYFVSVHAYQYIMLVYKVYLDIHFVSLTCTWPLNTKSTLLSNNTSSMACCIGTPSEEMECAVLLFT